METSAPVRASARTTGTVRRSSSSSGTGSERGRVDSPPMSRMPAPSPASCRPCVTAASASNHSPPSENESGVTLTTPMIWKGRAMFAHWTLVHVRAHPLSVAGPDADGPCMGDHARRRAPGDAGREPSALERAQQRWGVERALLAHGAGLEEESDLARHLQRHLRHLPVVMLHDRWLPDGETVVAHLAVAPGGVTVIEEAADDLEPPLQVERLRGVFAARVELLRDAARVDRTAVLAPLWERLAAVRRIVADAAPVEGALCVPGAGRPQPLRPLSVHGILVGDAKAVAAFAARYGDLSD